MKAECSTADIGTATVDESTTITVGTATAIATFGHDRGFLVTNRETSLKNLFNPRRR